MPKKEASGDRELLTAGQEPKTAKRTRTIMNLHQNNMLMRYFLANPFPSTEVREGLARRLGVPSRTVQIWFQNQRQKAKNREESATGGEKVPLPLQANIAISNRSWKKSGLDVLADVAYGEYCRYQRDMSSNTSFNDAQ